MNDDEPIDQQGPTPGHHLLSERMGQQTPRVDEQVRLTSFARFYEMNFPRVYRHLSAQFSQHEQAEDLAQEVFLKAWRAWPPASTEHLSGWVATIAIRTAQDARRKHHTRPPSQSLEALLGWLEEVASPLDEAEAALSHLAFRTAWSVLSRRQRELLMRKAAGATLAELAQEAGCHRSTINGRLTRARRALRHRYEEASR